MARHSENCPVVLLSGQIINNFLRYKQTDEICDDKEEFRHWLKSHLKRLYYNTGFELYNVGSTFNDLGDNNCDLDICLRIDTDQTNDAATRISILKDIQYYLRNEFDIQSRFIPAKVALLQFGKEVTNYNFSVDLNVNETVGVANSYLLKWYTELDERLQPLAIAIKHWAENFGIKSAANGTLSSYSWSLMLIFYLQVGCDPPVLPSLHNKWPLNRILYSDYNDWIDNADNIEPPFFRSANNDILGELLLGFFRFYSEEFDFSEYGISIRVGTQAKLRNRSNDAIFIEEPFKRTNTASSLKSTNLVNILNSLRTTYENLERNCNLYSIL